MTSDRPRVGVSACLIGWEVRYAGGHKWTAAVAERIGQAVEWIPVCPELEIGLGVPREAIELVGRVEAPELIGVGTKRVLTGAMTAWAARRLEELERHELSGYVLKARSPSCGPRGVPVVYARRDELPGDELPGGETTTAASAGSAAGELLKPPLLAGTGIFARALLERFPGMPIVDETELADPDSVPRFLERVNDYRRSCRLR